MANEINGTTIGVYVDGTLVASSTGATLTINVAEINVTSKDSQGRKDILPGVSDWSVSVDFFDAVGSSNYEFSDFHALYEDKTRVLIQIYAATGSADLSYQGFAYLTSVSRDMPMEDAVTGSATLTGDNLLNETTVT